MPRVALRPVITVDVLHIQTTNHRSQNFLSDNDNGRFIERLPLGKDKAIYKEQ